MLAIVQTDVKRMLAYSSINHAGIVLVGLQAATGRGIEAMMFYLVAYAFMVVGSFGVVALIGRKGDGWLPSLGYMKSVDEIGAGNEVIFEGE